MSQQITFETEEDFERAVMKAIENRLQLMICREMNDYGDKDIKVQITSSDGIVFKADYAVK